MKFVSKCVVWILYYIPLITEFWPKVDLGFFGNELLKKKKNVYLNNDIKFNVIRDKFDSFWYRYTICHFFSRVACGLNCIDFFLSNLRVDYWYWLKEHIFSMINEIIIIISSIYKAHYISQRTSQSPSLLLWYQENRHNHFASTREQLAIKCMSYRHLHCNIFLRMIPPWFAQVNKTNESKVPCPSTRHA